MTLYVPFTCDSSHCIYVLFHCTEPDSKMVKIQNTLSEKKPVRILNKGGVGGGGGGARRVITVESDSRGNGGNVRRNGGGNGGEGLC